MINRLIGFLADAVDEKEYINIYDAEGRRVWGKNGESVFYMKVNGSLVHMIRKTNGNGTERPTGFRDVTAQIIDVLTPAPARELILRSAGRRTGREIVKR